MNKFKILIINNCRKKKKKERKKSKMEDMSISARRKSLTNKILLCKIQIGDLLQSRLEISNRNPYERENSGARSHPVFRPEPGSFGLGIGEKIT